MRRVLPGALLPLLLACPTPEEDKDEDDFFSRWGGDDSAGDRDSDDGGDDRWPLLQYIEYDCSDGQSCYWYLDADAELGAAELDLLETGDPTWECGPAPPGEVVCGVWHEFHDAFSYSGANDYGGDTFAIALDIEDSYLDQVDNESTLFDMGNREITGQVTVLVNIYDATGAWADCAVAGEYVEYYSSYCTNDWGGL